MKELKLCLPKADRERVTRQMEQITNTRNRQVNHYLHEALKRIIDFLVKEGVGTIIIGKNPLWKQEAGMGRRNNQNFLDLDPIPTYKPNDDTEYTFGGKRIGRRNRLYRTKDGPIICADVNGSYNILRKRRPDAFSKAKGVAPSGSSPRPADCFNRTHQTTRAVSIDVHTFWNYNTLKRILSSQLAGEDLYGTRSTSTTSTTPLAV